MSIRCLHTGHMRLPCPSKRLGSVRVCCDWACLTRWTGPGSGVLRGSVAQRCGLWLGHLSLSLGIGPGAAPGGVSLWVGRDVVGCPRRTILGNRWEAGGRGCGTLTVLECPYG